MDFTKFLVEGFSYGFPVGFNPTMTALAASAPNSATLLAWGCRDGFHCLLLVAHRSG